jgi:hypothetical protein
MALEKVTWNSGGRARLTVGREWMGGRAQLGGGAHGSRGHAWVGRRARWEMGARTCGGAHMSWKGTHVLEGRARWGAYAEQGSRAHPSGSRARPLGCCSRPVHPTWQRRGGHRGQGNSLFTLSTVNVMLTLI